MSSRPVNRVVLIVLDSVGIGNAPDAAAYGDAGSNTLGNIAKSAKQFFIPNLIQLGIANISDDLFLKKHEKPIGSFGRAIERSAGKDTTTGHWEIAGLHIEKPFPTFTASGFPKEVISAFESKIGTKTLGNISASGTEIIDSLGEEHVRTGFPIVYTSADSVFQIAAHEEVIPLERLYEMCRIAREILKGDFAVGRVIARPFVGKPGSFSRTSSRKDFSVKPFGKTILNHVQDAGLDVVAVGKISDIFNDYGITESVHTDNNMDGVEKTLAAIHRNTSGLIFTNLVDFDSSFGHRRDVEGYKRCLEEFDVKLPDILSYLKNDDVLILTADHGNDPTYKGSDHTRESVPVLIYGNKIRKGINIGTRNSFSDISATIAEMLNVKSTGNGESFMNKIIIKD